MADMLAPVAGRIVRYRRKLIMKNLRFSFPEKSDREIRRITRDFYRWLCDYFVETMRLGRMSESEIRRRMTFGNVELIQNILDSGRPVALMLGHYANWEWISSLPLHLKPGTDASQIYHPLENAAADEAFQKIRARFGSSNVALADTLRYLVSRHKEGIPTVTGFISDQAPGYGSTHLWIDFLNRETGVFSGPEKLMRRYGGAMIYCHVERTKRGYYHCRFELIETDVVSAEVFAPTRRYFSLLERQIRQRPEHWLWSHNRWKRPRISNDSNK